MAIQLASNCSNCAAFGSDGKCSVHNTTVGSNYTCNQFTFNAQLNLSLDCSRCARFETASCPHAAKATAGMSCEAWAPKSMWGAEETVKVPSGQVEQ